MDRTAMIRARVRVDNEDGSFAIPVCAESLRQAERAAEARYPESAVRKAFPLEPEYFFVDGPRDGGRTGLDTTEELIGTTRPE
jgi:hypothetical protein